MTYWGHIVMRSINIPSLGLLFWERRCFWFKSFPSLSTCLYVLFRTLLLFSLYYLTDPSGGDLTPPVPYGESPRPIRVSLHLLCFQTSVLFVPIRVLVFPTVWVLRSSFCRCPYIFHSFFSLRSHMNTNTKVVLPLGTSSSYKQKSQPPLPP